MTSSDLLDLLRNARIYNLEHGITGCLIYKDRDFMQFIEGEKAAIEHLFHQKISKDDRHHKIKVIWEGPTNVQSFKDWSMAFENLSKSIVQDSSFRDLSNEFSIPENSDSDTTAKRLFVNFIKLIKKDF